MKKNGFTLIELLAVIIILGILMIIAVPAVTKYINDSKKTTYVDTAKSVANGVRNAAHTSDLGMIDQNTTYYIPAEYVQLDNGLKSPYGDFTEAYVGVTVTDEGYNYYWISRDDSGAGVRSVTPVDKLKSDNIVTDIPENEVTSTIETTGIGNRKNIMIYNISTKSWDPIVLSDLSHNIGEDGGDFDIVIYPSGKNKSSVAIGDIVTIGTQEFYVVKHSGEDLILLSHYNLNVGDKKKASAPEGLQDSEIRGGTALVYDIPQYGAVAFSDTNYWVGKIGTDYPGDYCTDFISGQTCAYVFDSNSSLYPYVENYKSYLEGFGAEIKSARLLRFEEIVELGCEDMWCETAPAWVRETGYWLGSASGDYYVWRARYNSTVHSNSHYADTAYHGLRPVIVI